MGGSFLFDFSRTDGPWRMDNPSTDVARVLELVLAWGAWNSKDIGGVARWVEEQSLWNETLQKLGRLLLALADGKLHEWLKYYESPGP